MANDAFGFGNEVALNKQDKVERFLIKNRSFLLSTIGILVIIGIVLCVVFGVKDSIARKGVAALDAIEYAYTKNNDDISASDLASRQEKALAALAQYTNKGGVVGVRAAMLEAEIYFEKKDYEASMASWLKAAKAGEKHYTSPLCYYNAGICAEELGKNADAISYFDTAASKNEFYLAPHALFSLARVYEAENDFAKANETYQKLIDSYASDEYAKLAHSRIISLKASKKLSD